MTKNKNFLFNPVNAIGNRNKYSKKPDARPIRRLRIQFLHRLMDKDLVKHCFGISFMYGSLIKKLDELYPDIEQINLKLSNYILDKHELEVTNIYDDKLRVIAVIYK